MDCVHADGNPSDDVCYYEETLRRELAALTAERDALKADISAMRADEKAKWAKEYDDGAWLVTRLMMHINRLQKERSAVRAAAWMMLLPGSPGERKGER